MSNSNGGPTLTDRHAVGGIVALDGFDYQVWDGLLRLPAWLANPVFEQVIFEGIDDVEARFFAPHAPRGALLDRYQAKSGDLEPHAVRGVFETFNHFDGAYPNAVRSFTLVTPRLPASMRWLVRDAARLRNARPFYAPFSDLMAASDASFVNRCVRELDDELGRFVGSRVEVFERPAGGREQAVHAFGLELARAFPSVEVLSRRVDRAFTSLCDLASRKRGQGIGRAELLQTLETAVEESLGLSSTMAVHVRSDRNGADETALEIDASGFSGAGTPFPEPETWSRDLVEPLVASSTWLTTRRLSRVSLRGSYRLTTAFVLGWAFRSSVGFEVEGTTRDGGWSTDDRPRADESYPSLSLSEAEVLDGDRLIVSVGILRSPVDTLVSNGIEKRRVFNASLSEPITSAHAAQHWVAVVKQAVSANALRLGATAIDLYYAGPAAFAVALGHRWNAMVPTQLFEFVASTQNYVATARLP